MKKSLLLGITGLTIIALTATTLFAQTTTGTSIVDKMKAAVHAFTLGSSLGQTGLESSPIAGKKTGDILTAGEWNRMLELLSENNTSLVPEYDSGYIAAGTTKDFGFNWDLITIGGIGEGGNIVEPAVGYLYKKNDKYFASLLSYHNVWHKEFEITATENCTNPANDLTSLCAKKSGDNILFRTGGVMAVEYLITKFNGGNGIVSSPSSGWADVPLTDTADFDTNCEYRFKLDFSADVTNVAWMNATSGIAYPSSISVKFLGQVLSGGSFYGVQSTNKSQYGSRNTVGGFTPATSVQIVRMQKQCG